MAWARIVTKSGVENFYVGVAQLTDSRALELQVIAPTEAKMAETLFWEVVGSISVKDDVLLEGGGRFIEGLKNIGLKALLAKGSDEVLEKVFLIDKTADSSEGFLIDDFGPSLKKEGWLQVKRQCLQRSTDNKIKAGICSMQCDNRFDNFIWQGKNSCTGVRRKGLFLAELSDGKMEVSNMVSSRDKVYWISQATIPATLLDMAAGEFLDFEEDRIIVDAIFPGGIIVPTCMSKVSVSADNHQDVVNGESVRLDLLYARGNYHQLFFDEQRQVVKRIEQGTELLRWQVSDRQTVMEEFSGWEEDFGKLLD